MELTLSAVCVKDAKSYEGLYDKEKQIKTSHGNVLVPQAEGYGGVEGKYFEKVVIDCKNREQLQKFLAGPYFVSPYLFNGARKQENWVETTAIVIDVDDKPLKWAIDKVEEWECDYIVRYSKSMDVDGEVEEGKESAHIFIPLKDGIVDLKQQKRLELVLAEELLGVMDLKTNERARFYYCGSRTRMPRVHNGKGPLDAYAFMDSRDPEVVEIKKKAYNFRDMADKSKKSTERCEWLTMDTVFVTSRYGPKTLGELIEMDEEKYPGLCIVCGNDEKVRGEHAGNHNAVFYKPDNNKYGAWAHQCSSCASRGMPEFINFKSEVLAKNIMQRERWAFFYDLANGCKTTYAYLDRETGRVATTVCGHDFIKNKYEAAGIGTVPKAFPEYRLDLVPNREFGPLDDIGVYNKYDPPAILEVGASDAEWRGCLMDKYFRHVLGAGSCSKEEEDEVVEHFYDWFATIVQTRSKVLTTFLLQGTGSTGKGSVFEYVIKPLFGARFCTPVDQKALTNKFNKAFNDNVFILLDEVRVDYSAESGSAFKQMIGNKTMSMEGKFMNAADYRVNANFLVATNDRGAVRIDDNDRRLNVGYYQEAKLEDMEWVQKSRGGVSMERWLKTVVMSDEELMKLVGWLKSRVVVNTDVVSSSLRNRAWKELVTMTQYGTEPFWKAVATLDYDWFIEELRELEGKDGHFRSDLLKDEIACGAIKSGTVLTLFNLIYREHRTHLKTEHGMAKKFGLVSKAKRFGTETHRAYVKG